MSRKKGSKNLPAKKRAYNRKPKVIGDNETELLAILLQTINGLSEDGKKRCLSYIMAKYEKYIPVNK